jgi:hypothetical protein
MAELYMIICFKLELQITKEQLTKQITNDHKRANRLPLRGVPARMTGTCCGK